MPETVRRMLLGILALIFAASTFMAVQSELDKAEGEEIYREAARLAEQPSAEPEKAARELPQPTQPVAAPTEPSKSEAIWVPMKVEADSWMKELSRIDLEALREINPDVIGWISIPDTKLHYPVVKGEDNAYYLEHAWDRQPNRLGSVFLEKTNQPDLKDYHSMLYGHNMRDQSMFGSLRQYESRSYWEEHPYVYLVTDEGILRYEIYSTYKTEVGSDAYLVGMLEGASAERFLRFSCEEAQYDTGIVPHATDRILTLSTCVGNYDYRRVIHARLLMVKAKREQQETASPEGDAVSLFGITER